MSNKTDFSLSPKAAPGLLFVVVCLIAGAPTCTAQEPLPPTLSASRAATVVKRGDLVFHTSTSAQARAVAAATRSPLTHCGVVVERDGKLLVAEAVQPVCVLMPETRSLEEWVEAAADDRVIVKRLKDGMTDEQYRKLLDEMLKLEGEDYDIHFQWNDETIYCSEFIYDTFDRALGIKLGGVQRYRDLNLEDRSVRELIISRYKRRGLTFNPDEQIITPAAVAAAPELQLVATLTAD